jgi:hypothetical protein
MCDLVSNEKGSVRYTIDRDVVSVSEVGAERLEPIERSYNLHALLAGPGPDAAAARGAAILGLITKTIAVDTWVPDGKIPNIRMEGDHLTVIQPDEIQRRIPELLTQLWLLENGRSTDPQGRK